MRWQLGRFAVDPSVDLVTFHSGANLLHGAAGAIEHGEGSGWIIEQAKPRFRDVGKSRLPSPLIRGEGWERGLAASRSNRPSQLRLAANAASLRISPLKGREQLSGVALPSKTHLLQATWSKAKRDFHA